MKREKRFLTTGEIAPYSAVTHLTVAHSIRDGKLFASRTPGGHNRIRRDGLQRFLLDLSIPVPQELATVGKQILMVDDERALADVMAHTLQQDGYQVSVAFDGYEAGLKMATLQPDLLVLDLLKPGLDGLSICQHVKAHSDGKGTKIIALIGSSLTGNHRKARACRRAHLVARRTGSY